jgi:hypothetical protein
MLTKTRTTIITFIAVGSFATATVAPAASQGAASKPGPTTVSVCNTASPPQCHDVQVAVISPVEGIAPVLGFQAQDPKTPRPCEIGIPTPCKSPLPVVAAEPGVTVTTPARPVMHQQVQVQQLKSSSENE